MSDSDYEVGYGKPPKHTQFKKGQSGNPKGRKKGARGLKTDLRAELNEQIKITENGKTKKHTKQQLMVKQLTNKALKGDVRAISKLTDLLLLLLGPEDEVNRKYQKLASTDQEILNQYFSKQTPDKHDD